MYVKYKMALVFGGQGSQFAGMGKRVYELFPKAREVFDMASEIVKYDVAKMCFEGSQKEINRTLYCQICTLTVELASYLVLKESNFAFNSVSGFSLGEYAALVAANVLDIQAALELVKERSLVMEACVKDNVGGMAAIIGLTNRQVESICNSFENDKVSISNYNSYRQNVISYYVNYYDEIKSKIQILGGRVVPLKVNRPFHHTIMRPAAKKFKSFLQKQNFNIPNCTIYLNVTGEKYKNEDLISKKLYEQIFMPVQWVRIIENMKADGIGVFYEISPKSTLGAFIKNIFNDNVTVVDFEKLIL